MRQRVARLLKAIDNIPQRYWTGLKLLCVVASVLVVGWPQLRWSLHEALRYEHAPADYKSVLTWIDSAECARKTGAWAAHCVDGKLAPMLADDPGSAILLGLWARIADRPMTLVDVARLILLINTLGLLVLASTLLLLRAFWAATVILLLGPYVFLQWFGTSPHWQLIGVAAMQVALPLGLIARWQGWLRPAVGTCLIVAGFVLLALGSLLREVIGSMALMIVLAGVAWIAWHSLRQPRRLAGLLLVAVLALGAAQSARLAIATRDRIFAMDTWNAIDTHGMSHNLFMGLGAVPNKFGIKWDDNYALDLAAERVPGIKGYSREYFQLMWRLYLEKWREDPIEAARVYLEKLKAILGERILDSAPPLWIVLTLAAVVHWLGNGRRLSCGGRQCDTRLAINLVAAGFIGFFVLQAVLAHPSRLYAAPAGAFILVLAGVALDNIGGWMSRGARRLAEA